MSFNASRWAIEIDGVQCSFVKKCSLPTLKAEETKQNLGPNHEIAKFISSYTTDMTGSFEIALGVSKPMNEWIATYFASPPKPMYKDVVVYSCNDSYEILSETILRKVYLTEVKLPSLDASGKDIAYVTVNFHAEETEFNESSGKVNGQTDSERAKAPTVSSFRVTIDGAPEGKHISKWEIGSFKHNVVKSQVGTSRIAYLSPGTVEVTNPKLTVLPQSQKEWASWQLWARKIIVNGDWKHSQQHSGNVVIYGQDNKTELISFDYFGIGPLSLKESDKDASQANPLSLDIELYAESMRLTKIQ